jgi:hypothetical protein
MMRGMTERPGAYFISGIDGLQPVPAARSPWSADMLHGRLLAGLAARAVEGASHDPELSIARLTVDMFRSPPMSALHVTTSMIRSGRRVCVMEVSIRSTDTDVARARALLLRRGAHPDGAPWRAPVWDVPLPDTLPAQAGVDENASWEIRLLNPGGFWTAERKQLWTRDRWQLVEGEGLSPAVRAALAADLPNPMANSSAEGLQFINADLTLFLARPPVSEWIGVEVAGHVGHDGIAVGTCSLYDTTGPFGSSTVCAITNTATLRD